MSDWTRRMALFLAIAAMLGSSRPSVLADDRCEGASPPPGFQVVQSAAADLDGDGIAECITVLLRPLGAGAGGAPQGDVLLRVTRMSKGQPSTIGAIEMTGRPGRFAVVRLAGSPVPVVVAGAAHCGGSCSGMELYVVRVGLAGLERLFESEEVQRGSVIVTRQGRMDVYEGLYGLGGAPTYTVSSYEARGAKLVQVARRQGPPDRAEAPVGSIRVEP